MDINAHAAQLLSNLRAQKPLIHHITNLVVTNDTANVTLHVGALPVMAHAIEEVEEMAAMAGCLLLNIGTLSSHWVEAMLKAGRRANALGIPVVLDPVGAGATSFRTSTCKRMLDELKISVVRGNLGEIATLAGLGGEVRGVESIGASTNAPEAAKALARQRNLTVAVTGARDVVCDGKRIITVDNGHAWLTSLTGTGCSSSTAVACFLAVEKDSLLAAASGLAFFGLAAEKAAPQANGPASFKVAFHDALYNLTPAEVAAGGLARWGEMF